MNITKIPLEIGNKHSRSQAMYNSSSRERPEVAFFLMSCLRIYRSIKARSQKLPSLSKYHPQKDVSRSPVVPSRRWEATESPNQGQQLFPSGALSFSAGVSGCKQHKYGEECPWDLFLIPEGESGPATLLPVSWQSPWSPDPGVQAPLYPETSLLTRWLLNSYNAPGEGLQSRHDVNKPFRARSTSLH